MKIRETQGSKTITKDVICDSCGKSCKVNEGVISNENNPSFGEPYYSFEYMELEAYWGYFSQHDCEAWFAQICENCVIEKLPFVKFEKRDYL